METEEDYFPKLQAESLQDKFLKFLSERKRQIREKSFKAKLSIPNRDSLEYQSELRQKFLDRVRHYIGIPYARKFHEPGTELYNSPLFLDCCALVRQTLDDLKEEFGFRVGR